MSLEEDEGRQQREGGEADKHPEVRLSSFVCSSSVHLLLLTLQPVALALLSSKSRRLGKCRNFGPFSSQFSLALCFRFSILEEYNEKKAIGKRVAEKRFVSLNNFPPRSLRYLDRAHGQYRESRIFFYARRSELKNMYVRSSFLLSYIDLRCFLDRGEATLPGAIVTLPLPPRR